MSFKEKTRMNLKKTKDVVSACWVLLDGKLEYNTTFVRYVCRMCVCVVFSWTIPVLYVVMASVFRAKIIGVSFDFAEKNSAKIAYYDGKEALCSVICSISHS